MVCNAVRSVWYVDWRRGWCQWRDLWMVEITGIEGVYNLDFPHRHLRIGCSRTLRNDLRSAF